MMRFSPASALLGLAAAAMTSHAQTGPWLLQSPGTTNWPINDIAFTSPDHGFFCGSNKELMETHDRGRTWTTHHRWSGPSIDGEQYYTLAFFDAQRGILIGNGEQPAEYTVDGGATWRLASGARPYGREFFDIASPTHAFLGGSQFSTDNFGQSWTMHPWDTNLGRIFSFDMRDPLVGLMASETYVPPIVAGTYRTTNGGQSWARIADWGQVLWLPDGTALNARPYPLPEFISLPLFDRGAEVYRSTDAGVTWQLIAEHVAPGLLDQQQGFWQWCALDATTVCGVTLSGKVWRSTDAGVTWTLTQPIDLIRGPVPDTTMSIRAFGQQVWIVGELGIAMSSDDGGQSWSFPASGVGLDIREISMRDDLVGLAAAGGFVLRTTDGGQHWTPTRLNVEGIDDWLPPDRDYLEGHANISWASPTTVYLQGGAGNCCSGRMTIWKSIDAGVTWEYVFDLENQIRIQHFDCSEMIWLDESRGYLLGYDVDPFGVGPSGYKTTDGGQTWTWMNSLLQSSVYSADFIDADNGWIQFSQTSTAYTTNGGDTWSVVNLPGYGFNDFDMLNLQVGFAVGVLGETYKTTNGGRAWTLLPTMSEMEDYYEVEALSPTEAVLIGRDNTDQTHFRFFIRRTVNGGQTWTRENLPDDWNTRYLHAYHLDALAGNKVLVAGRGGLIGSNAVPPGCPADFNASGGASVQDVYDFLGAWLASEPRADFNRIGGVTTQDIYDFLAAWLSGC